MLSTKHNTTQFTKKFFFLKKQKYYYQNKRKHRFFFFKKKTSYKKINKWSLTFTPIIYVINNTTLQFMLKVKNNVKHRRFTVLRKKIIPYGHRLEKKNLKWHWWKEIRIDELKLWYLMNFIMKTKTFKNFLIPQNKKTTNSNNNFKNQKKKKSKKKKIKFLKKFLTTNNLQIFRTQMRKIKINTSPKLQINTRSYINFLVNKKWVDLKYTNLRYEQRYFFDNNKLLFEKMPLAKQINRLKYRDSQESLRRFKQIIKILSWIKSLNKRQ